MRLGITCILCKKTVTRGNRCVCGQPPVVDMLEVMINKLRDPPVQKWDRLAEKWCEQNGAVHVKVRGELSPREVRQQALDLGKTLVLLERLT